MRSQKRKERSSRRMQAGSCHHHWQPGEEIRKICPNTLHTLDSIELGTKISVAACQTKITFIRYPKKKEKKRR